MKKSPKIDFGSLLQLAALNQYIEVMTEDELLGILIGGYIADESMIERWQILREASRKRTIEKQVAESYAKQQ